MDTGLGERVQTEETKNVGSENEDGREAERMGLDGRRQLSPGEVRNGVSEAAAGAEGGAERVKRTEADQMRSVRVHGSHAEETHAPEKGFDRYVPTTVP